MEIKLTPREERSRDRWREKGRLAEIQTTEGLSREELAQKFSDEAAEKTALLDSQTVIVYQSDEQIAIENARWHGEYHARILKGFGFKKKK